MCSPKAYSFIRKYLPLPGVSTIRRWLSSYDGRPGVFTESLDYLKKMHQRNSWQYSQCALMVDGMAIRQLVEWDAKNKKFIGNIDFGDAEERTIKAREALVFMCVGLIGTWKIPVGYVLTNCKNCLT